MEPLKKPHSICYNLCTSYSHLPQTRNLQCDQMEDSTGELKLAETINEGFCACAFTMLRISSVSQLYSILEVQTLRSTQSMRILTHTHRELFVHSSERSAAHRSVSVAKPARFEVREPQLLSAVLT